MATEHSVLKNQNPAPHQGLGSGNQRRRTTEARTRGSASLRGACYHVNRSESLSFRTISVTSLKPDSALPSFGSVRRALTARQDDR